MNKVIFLCFLYLLSCKGISQDKSKIDSHFLSDSTSFISNTPNILFLKGVIGADSVTLNLCTNTISPDYYNGLLFFDRDGIPNRVVGYKTIFMDKEGYSINVNDLTHERLQIEKHGSPNRNEIALFGDSFRIKGTLIGKSHIKGIIEYNSIFNLPNKTIELYEISRPITSNTILPTFSILKKQSFAETNSKLDWNKRYMDSLNINSFNVNSENLFTQLIGEYDIKTVNIPTKFNQEEYETIISPNNSLNTTISYCDNNLISGFFEVNYNDPKKMYWQEIPFLFDIKTQRQVFLADVLLLDNILSEKLKRKIPMDYKPDFNNLEKSPLFITPLGITLITKFKRSSEDIQNNFIFIPFTEIADNMKPYFKNLIVK